MRCPLLIRLLTKKRNRQHQLKNKALHRRTHTTILRISTITTRPESELHPKQQTSWPVKQNGLTKNHFYLMSY